MELVAREIPCRRLGGSGEFTVAAGKRVNVRYWAPGETVALDETVPKGKQWAVIVTVSVVETDA